MRQRDGNLELEKSPVGKEADRREAKPPHPLLSLQQVAGNQAVQRMIARASPQPVTTNTPRNGAIGPQTATADVSRSAKPASTQPAALATGTNHASHRNASAVGSGGGTHSSHAVGANSHSIQITPGLGGVGGTGGNPGPNSGNRGDWLASSSRWFSKPGEDVDAGGGRVFAGSRGTLSEDYATSNEWRAESGTANAAAPKHQSSGAARRTTRSPSTPLQRTPAANPVGATTKAAPVGKLAQELSAASGRPLDPGVRTRMEQSFGYDFSAVRIHAGSQAAEFSRQLGARAFATGTNIAFAPGEYRPSTVEGISVLAHELAHVVQQTGAAPATGASYAGLEKQAETASVHAISGRPVVGLSAMAVAAPQMLEKPDATGLDDVPAATMSSSFSGLFLQPPYSAKLSIATSWLRQVAAVFLKRLLGPRYEPGKLENDAIKKFNFTPTGRLADKEAEQKARDKKEPAIFYGFMVLAPLALAVINWLRSGEAGEKYAVDILPSQEELLVLGLELSDLWKRINQQAADQNKTIPKWYSEGLFRQDMNNFGALLRQFHSAATDTRDAKAGEVLSALLPAVLAMEAIRRDTSLADKSEYALLWNKKGVEAKNKKDAKAPAAPVKAEIVPEDTLVGFSGISMLVFERTQPALMEAAVADTDEGKSARLELLTRYGRFFQRMPVGLGGGDQKLLDKPGFFNTRPFPARLTAYPEPGFPIPQEPQGREVDFIMGIDVRDFWEAWTTLSYHFRFELIKIPDERFLNTATSQEKTEVFSRWKLYKRRLARDSRYNAADVLRIMGRQKAILGAPGTAADLVHLNALLRYAGTTISTILQAVFDPSNLARFTLPEEGLYIVRCAAGVNTPENAEVKRPPSVAYLQIFSVDPEVLAESQLQTELSVDEQADARLKEINDLLKDPNAPNRDDLLKEKDKIEKQKTIAGSLQVAKQDLQDLIDKSTDVSEKERLQKRIDDLNEISDMRTKRGLDKDPDKIERIPAVFVGDNGQVITLLLEAVDKSDANWPPEKRRYYVSDSTTPNSGEDTETGEVSAEEVKKGLTAKGKAILFALKSILEGTMGYGRGNVSVVVGSNTMSQRIEASESQILLEGISNLATVASVAAIAAAPFTGGESLVLLIPIGIIGAIPSAYRLATRAEAGNLRNDLSTWMDIVNIVSAFVGLGSEAQAVKQLAKQAIVVRGGLMITAIGTHGLNVVLLGEDVKRQLDEVGSLPPELRASHIAEIIEGAAVNAGIMIGGMLAARYRIKEAVGTQEKSVAEWKESLSEKTKELIKEPGIFAKFMEMTARVREVLTHCSDYCIPKNVTKEQAARVESLLERTKATPDDERAIKIYFHDQVPYDADNPAEQQKKMEAAIKALEDQPTLKDLRRFLDKTVPVSDRVLGLFEKLRNDPDLQKLVNKIVDPKQGGVSVRLLGDIMDEVKARRGGAARILDYIDRLTTKKPTGYERVLADLAKGYNFFTGAEWVLRFITERKLWDKVKAFEIEETDPDGTRRWDARIGQTMFQFKSWIKFWASTFIKQIHQDFLKSGSFGKFLVQWVFDPKIGDAEFVRKAMIAALDDELAKPEPRISKLEADAIKARLNDILVVGVGAP